MKVSSHTNTHTHTHQLLTPVTRTKSNLDKDGDRVSSKALAGIEEQRKSAYDGKHTPSLFHRSCKTHINQKIG